MTFADMLLEIYTLTNRADLSAETALALKKATFKFHAADFWPRDLTEVLLNIAVPSNVVQIDANVDLPRLRAVAYIRDAGTGTPGFQSKMYQKIEPRGVLDDYLVEKLDVWYQGGAVINIKGSVNISNVIVGYYANPVINPVGVYASWIADELPYILIEEAAATIFKMTGNAEMARFYDIQGVQNLALLRQNYLEGVAR